MDENTGCWYYEGIARLANGTGDTQTPNEVGTPNASGTPGSTSQVRRSKRSSTPGAGHFAKIERAMFLLDHPKVKRRKSDAWLDDANGGSPAMQTEIEEIEEVKEAATCLLYTSPSPRDRG